MDGDMFEQTDQAYFERRAAEELALANLASDPAVKAIHFELAARYAEKAKTCLADGTIIPQVR